MPAGALDAGSGRSGRVSAAAGHSQLAASANISSPWHKSRGGVTRPGAEGVTRGRSRSAAPRSPLSRAEAARNPSGGGRFFCSNGGSELAAQRDHGVDRLFCSEAVGFVVRFFLRKEEITRIAILLTPRRATAEARRAFSFVPRDFHHGLSRPAASRRRVFKRTAPRFRRRCKARWRRAGRRIGRPAWKACWSLP